MKKLDLNQFKTIPMEEPELYEIYKKDGYTGMSLLDMLPIIEERLGVNTDDFEPKKVAEFVAGLKEHIFGFAGKSTEKTRQVQPLRYKDALKIGNLIGAEASIDEAVNAVVEKIDPKLYESMDDWEKLLIIEQLIKGITDVYSTSIGTELGN
jgi:hypothetical protein